MDTILRLQGKIRDIIFYNPENGYSVVDFITKDDFFVAVGILPPVSVGEELVLQGNFQYNKKHGRQFCFEQVEFVIPNDLDGIKNYLSSDLFYGIGPKTAKQIVDTFGLDTLGIIENAPNRLTEVKGISELKARRIAESYIETIEMKNVIIFFQKYGIGLNLAMKIYTKYGNDTINVVKTNPYLLVSELEGVGFRTADKIALTLGIPTDSPFRIKAGIYYVLNEQAVGEGHTCYPEYKLLEEAFNLLNVNKDMIQDVYSKMDDLMRVEYEGELLVATKMNYYIEGSIASKLIKLNATCKNNDLDLENELVYFENYEKIHLDPSQRNAVKSIFDNGVTIITGGPGTGKTTIINAICAISLNRGLKTVLCAPTGRAAKRMSAATNQEAKTIHRTIGLGTTPSGEPTNILDTDIVIVDEISMADIFIFNALLKSIKYGTRLVLVGDKDQLPSVACGNILSDCIYSRVINVVSLNQIHRQKDTSMIVSNAHLINEGQMPIFKGAEDFFMISKDNPSEIYSDLISLMGTRLPKYLNITMDDVQVLAPSKKGTLGVDVLNEILSDNLNKTDVCYTHGHSKFKLHDRVMQTCNNYDTEWRIVETHESGKGVFNGDIGVVIDVFRDSMIYVKFDDGKVVK